MKICIRRRSSIRHKNIDDLNLYKNEIFGHHGNQEENYVFQHNCIFV